MMSKLFKFRHREFSLPKLRIESLVSLTSTLSYRLLCSGWNPTGNFIERLCGLQCRTEIFTSVIKNIDEKLLTARFYRRGGLFLQNIQKSPLMITQTEEKISLLFAVLLFLCSSCEQKFLGVKNQSMFSIIRLKKAFYSNVG